VLARPPAPPPITPLIMAPMKFRVRSTSRTFAGGVEDELGSLCSWLFLSRRYLAGLCKCASLTRCRGVFRIRIWGNSDRRFFGVFRKAVRVRGGDGFRDQRLEGHSFCARGASG
jgi:hypothetical protein